MIVCRKVNEAVFLQAVLSIIREKKWDLDDLACHFCKTQSVAESSKSHHSAEEVKVHQAQALAKFMIEQLEPFAANMSSSSSPAQQEIESLRAQLEAEKARNSTFCLNSDTCHFSEQLSCGAYSYLETQISFVYKDSTFWSSQHFSNKAAQYMFSSCL